jgi:hypothetical protein
VARGRREWATLLLESLFRGQLLRHPSAWGIASFFRIESTPDRPLIHPMTDVTEDILRRVARMAESDRYGRAEELVHQYGEKLAMPLHRQILDCLVGRRCTSRAARSWAESLMRESRDARTS